MYACTPQWQLYYRSTQVVTRSGVSCTQQEFKARLGTVEMLLEASEAEKRGLVDAQLLQLQRLERELLLSGKDRRVREALEYAISVIRGAEVTAHEGGHMSCDAVLTCR